MRVTSGGSSDGGGVIEGTPDDGYSWRKYGQKDILGAKFPRFVEADTSLFSRTNFGLSPEAAVIAFPTCTEKLPAFFSSFV